MKYRIVLNKYGKYEPQSKSFFFWRSFLDFELSVGPHCQISKMFKKLKCAEEFIKRYKTQLIRESKSSIVIWESK